MTGWKPIPLVVPTASTVEYHQKERSTLEINALLNPPRTFPAVLSETTIKFNPEDFEVEEIPAYQPTGEGEHLFLWVEKRDVSAGYLSSQLARSLNIRERDLGMAGQKDRRAVTRQFVSVPRTCLPNVVSSVHGDIRILSATAHTNKLRTGHVNGNRFRLVLRPADGVSYEQSQADDVRQRLEQLSRSGFPNYFGPQRFGHNGQTALNGIDMLQPSQATTATHPKPPKRRMRRLLASAAQSAVFNQLLAKRVREGTFRQCLSGDVVCRRGGTRPFLFDERGDTAVADLIPMGPMPGPKMLAATGDVAVSEKQTLDSLGLSTDAFAAIKKLTPGTRRAYVAFPQDSSAELFTDGAIEIRFALPSGSYATVVLAEICRELVAHR